jgi:nucleoside-diphosphate-sugar epimerase
MKRIAIVGANGQVGTEVCLTLKLLPGVEVVPVCRSEISAAFLRRCGLEVRIGRMDDANSAPRLLAGCDVVADCSLPAGTTLEVERAMRSLVPNLGRYAPRGSALVYMSSITAFGIPDFHHPLRSYRISRNRYGACKRYGEKLALRCGRDTGRPVYVLRLGVVHGELQEVSRHLTREMRRNGDVPVLIPDCESYTVFAFTIAEALVGIANGAEAPGVYTALSNPAWSWKDIHEWYAARAGVKSRLQVAPASTSAGVKSLVGVIRRASRPLMRVCAGYKEVVGAYLAAVHPGWGEKMRATYLSWRAAAEIAAGREVGLLRPYPADGSRFPGRRLRSVSDSRITMRPYAEQVRTTVEAASAGAGLGARDSVEAPPAQWCGGF